mmetsp:Transcript_6423/g.13793  ORF Transcript_6423/g.13793 Transcript_6423/m.13793 type:complete len:910 (+) Transcript_6423:91-2820(+)
MGVDREKDWSCTFGSFRLLNCWEQMPTNKNSGMFDAMNVYTGFVLKPGENRSLYIEHIPDCKLNKEFVTLNVQLRHDSPERMSRARGSRSRRMKNPFLKKENEMFFGYEMDDTAYSRCTPVDTRLSSPLVQTDLVSLNSANHSSRIELKSFGNDQEENPLLLCQVFLFSTAAFVLCYALRARFNAISAMLKKSQGEPTKNVHNWNAAFRCLARSNPTSTELQTMIREQMRQDVIGRYRAKGNTTSSSLNSTNGFSRDRQAAISKTSRHKTGKERNSGNERIRPFSDALFHDTSIVDDSSLRLHFPIGLGWRTAYSRGIIKDNSLNFTSFTSRTKDLLSKRARMNFENDEKIWNDDDNTEMKLSEKGHSIPEKLKKKSTPKLSNVDNSNGAKSEVVKNKNAEITGILPSSVSDRTITKIVEGNNTGGEQQSKVDRVNSNREIVPALKRLESPNPVRRKEIPSKPISKTDKQKKGRDERPITTSKTGNANVVPKKVPKLKNHVPKINEREDANKTDKLTKNASRGQSQKQQLSAKIQSNLLGTSPKGSSSNAWQGERQKADAKPPGKKQTVIVEKKSKAKEKSKKKKTAKPNVQGKKVHSNSIKLVEPVSLVSTENGAKINDIPTQPVLSPPPGFGAPRTNITISPNAHAQLDHVSTADSQLSLDTVLHPALTGGSKEADPSLGAPSQGSSATLPFALSNMGGTDLFSIRKSNLSPTTHGFHVADVALQTENNNTLVPSIDQPWLHTLRNEEPELVEQPWLPALLDENQENGFDVMDFLDGILQEGAPPENALTLEIEPPTPGTTGNIMGSAIGNPSSTPVSANPWPTESRAAAYGISFDDEDGNNTKISTTGFDEILKGASMEKVITGGALGSNIPLLTPAAILNAEENGNIVVEDDDRVNSFYAGLLDE